MTKEIDMEMNDVVDLDAAFAQFWCIFHSNGLAVSLRRSTGSVQRSEIHPI